MLPVSSPRKERSSDQLEISQEELAHLLVNTRSSHPALNRVCNRLAVSAGVETQITSYDRMHHRHNRS